MTLRYEGRDVDMRKVKPREPGHDMSRLRSALQDFVSNYMMNKYVRTDQKTMERFYDTHANGDIIFRDKLVAAMRPFLER